MKIEKTTYFTYLFIGAGGVGTHSVMTFRYGTRGPWPEHLRQEETRENSSPEIQSVLQERKRVDKMHKKNALLNSQKKFKKTILDTDFT